MRITPLPLRLYWHLLNLIAPAECPVCQKSQHKHARAFLCTDCRPTQKPQPHCHGCGRTLPDIPSLKKQPVFSCRFCRTQKHLFCKAISVAPYRNTWREAILKFKLEHQGDLTWQMAHLLLRQAQGHLPWNQIQALVPIPGRHIQELHPTFRLTRCLAQLGDKPFYPCLGFSQQVVPQRGLKRKERLRNMQNKLHLHRQLPFTSIMLIDDVLTTGATVQEGARALLAAGATHVYIGVLAQGWSE